MALHAWKRPRDPSIYGFLDLDVTELTRWIEETRAGSGVHVTLTHVIGLAAARAIRAHPDVNAIVRSGRGVWQRDAVDVFFMIARDAGEDLLGAVVERADEKDAITIARELERRINHVRAHQSRDLDRTSTILAKLPDWLVSPAMRATEIIGYDLGLDLRRIGLPYDAFGSVMVTNVGTFGLERALAPLVPFARAPIVITVGRTHDAPVAVDGQVVVRPIVTLGVTCDHRVLDGARAGQLAQQFREVIERPFAILGAPTATAARERARAPS